MEISIKYKKKKNQYVDNNSSSRRGCFLFFFISNYCVEIRHSIEDKDQSTSQRSVLLLQMYIEKHCRDTGGTTLSQTKSTSFFFSFLFIVVQMRGGDDTVDLAISMPWHYNIGHTSKSFALYTLKHFTVITAGFSSFYILSNQTYG